MGLAEQNRCVFWDKRFQKGVLVGVHPKGLLETRLQHTPYKKEKPLKDSEIGGNFHIGRLGQGDQHSMRNATKARVGLPSPLGNMACLILSKGPVWLGWRIWMIVPLSWPGSLSREGTFLPAKQLLGKPTSARSIFLSGNFTSVVKSIRACVSRCCLCLNCWQ